MAGRTSLQTARTAGTARVPAGAGPTAHAGRNQRAGARVAGSVGTCPLRLSSSPGSPTSPPGRSGSCSPSRHGGRRAARRRGPAGGQRPHLRIRRGLAHRDPRQGRCPHGAVVVVVRAAGRHRARPRPVQPRAGLPRRARGLRRRAARPLDAVPAAGHGAGRVRRPRLPDRQRPGRLPARPAASAATSCPPGLRDGDRLPEPIYTPSTKAPQGEHDENITRADVVERIGPALAKEIERLTLDVYERAASDRPRAAASCWPTRSSSSATTATGCSGSATRCSPRTRRGSGRPTPGSPAAPSPPSTSSTCATGWPPPTGTGALPGRELPDHVVEQTRARYVEAYERLTGRSFDDYLRAA